MSTPIYATTTTSSRLGLSAVVLGMFLTQGVSTAATVSGLTVEDISAGAGNEVIVFNSTFTIVEWDGYESGGTPGNTVRTSTGLHYTDTSQGNDPLFWRRVGQGIPAGWTAAGGTNQRFRAESSGYSGTLPNADDGLTAQATTTIVGLDALATYQFFYIAGGRVNDTRSYRADFGAGAPTTDRVSDHDLFHIDGFGDNPFNNELGFYAVPLGLNSGSTSYTMSLEAPDATYWLGVGYVEVIPEPSTIGLAALGCLSVVGYRRRSRN